MPEQLNMRLPHFRSYLIYAFIQSWFTSSFSDSPRCTHVAVITKHRLGKHAAKVGFCPLYSHSQLDVFYVLGKYVEHEENGDSLVYLGFDIWACLACKKAEETQNRLFLFLRTR